jgi:hypothetical protein
MVFAKSGPVTDAVLLIHALAGRLLVPVIAERR